MKENCLTCRFWEPLCNPIHADENSEGECHRHAPIAQLRIVLKPERYDALWPFVYGRQGCGDYISK